MSSSTGVVLGSLLVSLWLSAGCGGSKRIDVGSECSLNSDCNSPLVCTMGKCHEACRATSDCPAGQSCVMVGGVGACQLPAEAKCSANVTCGPLLICASDLRCRTNCASAASCSTGQLCVQNVCADQTDLDINGQLPQRMPAQVDGGGPDAGESPVRDTGTPDVPVIQDASGDGGSGRADRTVDTGGGSGGIDAGGELAYDAPIADSSTSSGTADAGCNADGRALCDIGCVNVLTDKFNCGACGKKCLISCSNGQCNDPVELSGGAGHNCVRLSNGSVECWGYNSHGQLGTGSPANALSPVKTMLGGLGQAKAVSIAAGSRHSCAVLSDGSVTCWGSNAVGELGNASVSTNSLYPVSSAITSGALAVAVSGSYASGGVHSCALLSGGAITCWGDNTYGELGGMPGDAGAPAFPTDISGVTQVIAGPASTCILELDGSVRCWGATDVGQAAVGQSSKMPAPVPGLNGGVKYIAVSPDDYLFCGTGANATGGGPASHACALLADGSVRCWGSNSYGELGQLAEGAWSSATAVPVTGVSGATSIGVGITHSCAVVSGGAVVCWGNNLGGQLGNGKSGAADAGEGGGLVTVSGVSNAKAVVAGSCHSCALLKDGNVLCWGDNALGQLGNGSTQSSSTPVAVTW